MNDIQAGHGHVAASLGGVMMTQESMSSTHG